MQLKPTYRTYNDTQCKEVYLVKTDKVISMANKSTTHC